MNIPSVYHAVVTFKAFEFIQSVPNKIYSFATAVISEITYIHPISNKREWFILPSYLDIFIGRLIGFNRIWQTKGEDLELVKRMGTLLIEKGNLSSFKGFHWEFAVSKESAINAYCLPGGKIVVCEGLLDELKKDISLGELVNTSIEEMIAAVLSHEIVHAVSRHSVKNIQFSFIIFLLGNLLNTLLLSVELTCLALLCIGLIGIKHSLTSLEDILKLVGMLHNSKRYEFEADHLGMYLMETVCNNLSLISSNSSIPDQGLKEDSPQAHISLQEFFQKHANAGEQPSGFIESVADWIHDQISSIQRTHPTSDDRIEANKKTWNSILLRREDLKIATQEGVYAHSQNGPKQQTIQEVF